MQHPLNWDALCSQHYSDRSAVVLLSGGLDSCAAMLIAAATYPSQQVKPVSIDYGQPHHRELVCAGKLCAHLGIPWQTTAIADAMRPWKPGRIATLEDCKTGGLHPANIPGRNMLFLSLAAAYGAVWFDSWIDIWIGTTVDDHEGFPDCRPSFLGQAAVALSLGLGRKVSIVAPFSNMRKKDIVAAAKSRPDVLQLISDSYSCYSGKPVPCGSCTPCRLRTEALA